MNFIKSFLRIIRSVILILILAALIIFMVNNRNMVSISLYPLPFVIEVRMFLAMISFFIFGVCFSIIIYSKGFIRNMVVKFCDERKIKKLKKEIIERKIEN